MPDELVKSDYSVYDHASRCVLVREANHYKGIPTASKRYVSDDEIPTYWKPLTAVDHVAKAATYEWKCRDCGDSALSPFEGGNLDFDTCECDHTSGHNLEVWVILSGKRTYLNTVAGMEGRKPGEPAHRWTRDSLAE